MLDLQDTVDASDDFLDDLGRALPLSIPVMWFGLSVPAFLEAGYWLVGTGLGLAAAAMSVPLFLTVRSGLFKALDWRRARKELRAGDEQAVPQIEEGARRVGWQLNTTD